MADYVLVHGAWAGGWSFDRLARELRARGHRVLVAQMAGLGSRVGELNPSITLSMHIKEVCHEIATAGFARFVLVGHSYGGMVATGIAAKLGGRIDALVYLDAFLPGDGQSLWDLTGKREHDHYIASQKDTPGLVAPMPGLEHPRCGRQPLLTFLEAVHFTGEEAKVQRRIYVFAAGWQPSPFTRFRDKVKGDPAWEYHEMDCGHDVMAERPEEVLNLLLGCDLAGANGIHNGNGNNHSYSIFTGSANAK